MTSSSLRHPLCTIVIPTLAVRERGDSLRRAISSIWAGNKSTSRVLIVINGNRFDESLVAELCARSDIQVIQISTPSSPAAILAGRREISTPYFGFLDDDDEYLPGAVDARMAIMAANPEASVVITNGYRHLEGVDLIDVEYLASVSEDPLAALFRENWLASCGGLFRTDHMPIDLFEDSPKHIHWTWLAFNMAEAGKRIVILDKPTYRIYDTVGSSSKSETYLLCHLEIYRRMLERVSRPEIARILKSRLSQAYHQISNHHLKQGTLSSAWAAHLHSLCYAAGWKFLLYTRKLFWHVPRARR